MNRQLLLSMVPVVLLAAACSDSASEPTAGAEFVFDYRGLYASTVSCSGTAIARLTSMAVEAACLWCVASSTPPI